MVDDADSVVKNADTLVVSDMLASDMLALLAGQPLAPAQVAPAASDDPSTNALHLLHLVRAGAFAEVLRSPLARQLLVVEDVACALAAGRARAHLRAAADELPAAAISIQAIGAAALSLFAHANWSGARICRLAAAEVPLAAARCEAALEALRTDGEAAYDLLDAPGLLCAARALLVDVLDDLSAAGPSGISAPWWAARCLVLHQRCLGMPAPSLEKAATKAMRRTLEALEASAGAGASSAASDAVAGGPKGASAADPAGLGGQTVTVTGLEAKPELNGTIGVVGAYDAAKGRYAVKLEGGGAPMLLKPDNLVAAEPAAAEAIAAGAESGEGARAVPSVSASEADTASLVAMSDEVCKRPPLPPLAHARRPAPCTQHTWPQRCAPF